MCTRFVYRGSDMITGFNFDIDLSVWTHKVKKEKERFYIGILRPDGAYRKCRNTVICAWQFCRIISKRR